MEEVIFERLVLRGLGLFGGEASFAFSPGSNVLLGRNESGKSTMVEGLCGVLFGLKAPALQYRHWGGSRVFEGELWLQNGGVQVCVKRSFATNTIEVNSVDPAGRCLRIIEGVHKPEAHKPNLPYLEFLRATFGVTSSETFQRTYFVAQPLPEGKTIDVKVQELISGGGTLHHHAGEELQERLKKVTRNWRTYAPSLGNGTKDRELEIASAKKRELELRLAEQKGANTELCQVEEKLDNLLSELRTVKTSVLAQSRIHIAWQQWHVARDKYVTSRERARKIETDSAVADGLSQAITTVTMELSAKALPQLQKIVEEKFATLEEKASLLCFAPLGEHAVEHVRAVRLFVEERTMQMEDLTHDLAQALENERQAVKGETLLLTWADDYVRKYGQSPAMLSLDDFEKASARQMLRDKKSRHEDRLKEALGRPRRTFWPALAGLLAGMVVLMTVGDQVGLGAAALLLALGIVSSLSWRGKNPAAHIYEAQIAETEAALASHYSGLVFFDEHSSELLLAAKQDFLLYKDREVAVSENTRMAGERVRYLQERSKDFRQKLDAMLSSGGFAGARGVPRYFAEVLAVVSCDLRGQSLTHVLGDLQCANWDDVEFQALKYLGLSKQLLAIDNNYAAALKEVEHEISAKKDKLAYLLANYGVDDANALTLRKMDAVTDMMLARKEWQELSENYPGLPSPEQADDVLGNDQARLDLERNIELARAQVDRLEREIFALRNRQGYLVGQRTENLAQGEEVLAEFAATENRLRREARVLGMALTGLKSAAEEFHTAARGLLAERATHHFTAITGTDRQVVLDEDFAVFVIALQGNKITPAELSQGAKDQLYIAMRLAMADLVGAERVVPFLFDDPFLTTDGERLPKLRQAILSLGRQSLFLSHSEVFRDWGEPVAVTCQEN